MNYCKTKVVVNRHYQSIMIICFELLADLKVIFMVDSEENNKACLNILQC